MKIKRCHIEKTLTPHTIKVSVPIMTDYLEDIIQNIAGVNDLSAWDNLRDTRRVEINPCYNMDEVIDWIQKTMESLTGD